MKPITFADLFAGIGGFRLGLERLGWKCTYSAENNKHACAMYKANYGVDPYQDVTKLTNKDIKNIPKFDVLCAGFPCQSFSISGKKQGFLDKTRGTLFFYILKFLYIKKPKAFILENVKFLLYHNKGRTLSTMIDCLNHLGYTVNYKVLNAKNFGVPQNRARIVIVGNKEGKPFNFNNLKTHPVKSMKPFLDKRGPFEYLPKSDYVIIPKKYVKRQRSGLIFIGYRKGSIRKVGVRKGTLYLSRVHRMPRRIYSANGVHPTLSAQESAGRYWIYINGRVRKLKLDEAYRFMGFPDDFKKIGSKAKLYNRIGNSVCVNMITAVGKELENTLGNKLNKHNPKIFLENIYKEANTNGQKYMNELDGNGKKYVKTMVNHDHSLKGVYTALITSLTYKCLHPNQDVRRHQKHMPKGYSGRNFDKTYVTPFLNQHRFDAAMKESGWLTRSIEQPYPFTTSFPGRIENNSVKKSFLAILNRIETYKSKPKPYLIALLYGSIKKDSKENITIINPVRKESNLEISQIIQLLKRHFAYKNYANGEKGNSILPVLAVYSIYQIITKEMVRYKGKKLLPRASQYSADLRSGSAGDITVAYNDDNPKLPNSKRHIYEAVEVKYNIPETPSMIKTAYKKISPLKGFQRYYILSTKLPTPKNKNIMKHMVNKIYKKKGTQIIFNGLIPTLKYYLRLISNTNDFLNNYTQNLRDDSELNAEHKIAWNRIVRTYFKKHNIKSH